MKILIYAQRNWSLYNVNTILCHLEYDLLSNDLNANVDIRKYDLLLSCDPTSSSWRSIYTKFKNKIPIIGMQQSLAYNPYSSPNGYWPISKMMIWGNRYIKHHRSNGYKGKLCITGMPKYDSIFYIKNEPEDYILFLPFCGKRHMNHMLQHVKQAVKEYNVKIKLHPQDNAIYEKIPHVEYLSGNNATVTELIRKAKCVVISTTSAGIQAMIMETPIVSIGSIEEIWSDNYSGAGITYRIPILSAIDHAISTQPNDTIKLFLHDTITGSGSTNRVLNYLNQEIIRG